MIADYLDSLSGALSFDRSLSRRVRREVEDHLLQAVAADPAGDRRAAERRAIARFGDPRVIAAQFAAVSLSRQARTAGVAIVLMVAGVLIAMKLRADWYIETQWPIPEDMRAVGRIVLTIDAWAFWLAVVVGAAGLACVVLAGSRHAFDPAYRRHIGRFFILGTATAVALIVSVIGDGVLTALRLVATEWCSGFYLPLASMAVEIACACVLAIHVRGTGHRLASAAALISE
jgi:hypothetical protein